MTRRLSAFLTTTFFLLLTGALAGLVVAVLGLALSSALQSLQNNESTSILRFFGALFLLLIDVLAVSTATAPDGLLVGLLTAAAISVAYGVVLWLLPRLLTQRWGMLILFVLVGALTAALSLRGSLVGYGMGAAVGGALFGVVASFVVSRKPRVA